ncbi:Aste57867_14878 [Aphanomyces stellatus]|uniref:Adenosylcobinamide-GDP ribazoletransferase n=1 Tax=Aphanomyces stellatus TaxID=120398 RepID=A0A485L2Q2_9STRA|nr:hypothetical protein As57867_014822 [Aphanomyces stellatus]VFT91695.1 Aste57867_14878 [Aphanomyces stellatus]
MVGAAQVRDAIAAAFDDDLGPLQDTALHLYAFQRTFALRADKPVVIEIAGRPKSVLSTLSAASGVPYKVLNAMVDAEDGASSTETCMDAMNQGRDAINPAMLGDETNVVVFVGPSVATADATALVDALAHDTATPALTALFAVGGVDVSFLCGAIVQAASKQLVVVVDGYVAAAAALCARRLAPAATAHAIYVPSMPLSPLTAALAADGAVLCLPSLSRASIRGVDGLAMATLLHHAAHLVSTLGIASRDNKAEIHDAKVSSAMHVPYVDPTLPAPPELRIFLTSVMFLTRLPAYLVIPDLDHNVRELVPSFCYFPVIGWAVGGFAGLFFIVGCVLFDSTALAVIGSTFASVWLTGCFHEDGVADTFDSFGGGWSKNDILRIMKDSRLGTYGCTGLLLMTTLKFAALDQIASVSGTASVCTALVAAHVLGRYSSLFILQFFPYVEDERDPKGPLYNGIGNNLHLLTPARVHTATLFTAASMVLCLGLPLGLCVFSVGLLVSYLAGQYFAGFLGGVIGDCLGCANQVVEVVVYLCIIFVRTRGASVLV